MSSSRPAISKAAFDALIEEATVDCYNEEEQITGLFTMLLEHLALPFETLDRGIPPLARLNTQLSPSVTIHGCAIDGDLERRRPELEAGDGVAP